MFDCDGNGFITEPEITAGLDRHLGIRASPSEVQAFMTIFAKNDILKYTEFCDAFLPLDNRAASSMASKPPSEDESEWARDLDSSLRHQFAQVWQTHFRLCQSLA